MGDNLKVSIHLNQYQKAQGHITYLVRELFLNCLFMCGFVCGDMSICAALHDMCIIYSTCMLGKC